MVSDHDQNGNGNGHDGTEVAEKPKKPRSEMRQLVDNFFQCQRNRIAAENRCRAFAQGSDENKSAAVASDQIVEILGMAEKVALRRMEAGLKNHPVMAWAMGIPGMNRATIGRIAGMIDDPRQFPRFSNLRSFAGLYFGNNRRKKGEVSHYCQRLKDSLFIAFDCMLKQHNAKIKNPPQRKYTEIYYNWRAIYKTRFGEGDKKNKNNQIDGNGNAYTFDDETARLWPDQRQHLASKNKLLDVFLYHFYEEWLTNIGHSVPDLYVHAVLGHHMKFDRFEFSNSEFSQSKLKKHSTPKSLDRDIAEMKLDVIGPTGKVTVEV